MSLKGAFLAIAAGGAFLVVGACGGGVDSGSSQSQPGTAGDNGQLQVGSGGNGNGTGTGGSGSGNSIDSGTPAQYVAIDLQSSAYFYTSGWGVVNGEQAGFGNLEGNQGPCSRHALLWRGAPSSVLDLHPDGFCESGVLATSGGMQAGWGKTISGATHALKWAGSATSVVDLDPTGLRRSEATGISGDQVVGFGEMLDGFRAFLWTSRGVVDLHPSGFSSSLALATDGAQQVGRGDGHALLWRGSANSVVDLHPGREDCFSEAHGVSAGQQVGFIRCGPAPRALLWAGSAQSVVDLHPSGFSGTVATAVAAGRQVGWGTTADGSIHAVLWNGTADSVVDLHVFLPAGFRNSEAKGIDASGNIIGNADGHAILWRLQ